MAFPPLICYPFFAKPASILLTSTEPLSQEIHMNSFPRRVTLALAIGLTLIGTIIWLARPARFSPSAEEAQEMAREQEEMRRKSSPEDQPGEAAAFARLKRLAEGATEVPVDRY